MILAQAVVEDLRRLAEAWGPFLLVVVAATALGYYFERLVIRAVQRAAKSTQTELDDLIVRAVHPALVVAVFIAGVWFGVRYVGAKLPPEAIVWTNRLSLAVVVFLAALVAARLIQGFLRFRAQRQPQWIRAARLGSRVVSVVVYATALLIVLDYYGLEITPILASLGLAGLAVALALQDTLSNFFAGIWIQAGRGIDPGHFVRIEGEKLEGYVEEIGWRATHLRTLPNNLVIIPNAKLAQSVITDYHLPTPRMALLISISAGYEEDPDKIERILLEEALAAADTTPGLLKDPAPFVRLIPGFGDFALQFTLICQVREFTDQYLAQHEIRKRILARFRREGIRIPYPIRETLQISPARRDVADPKAATG